MRRVVIAILLVLELWYGVLHLRAALGGGLDFIAYYRAGSEILEHQNVYNLDRHAPFIHPAFEALGFVPLSFLNYKAAYIAFMALNLGLICWSLRKLGASWELVAFPPLTVALVFGQDSIIFLALLSASYLSLGKDKPFAAGLWLGACTFRFQNILPVILLFLIWREWKVLKGFAISAGIALMLSCLLVSPTAYVSALKSIAYGQPVERMVNLRALLGSFWVLAAPVVLGIAAAAGWNANRKAKLAVGIVAAALLSFHFFAHDLVILLVPMVDYRSAKAAALASLGCVLVLLNYAMPLVAAVSLGFLTALGVRQYSWPPSSPSVPRETRDSLA